MCGGICGPAGESPYENNIRVCAICHRSLSNCSCLSKPKKTKARGQLKKKSKKTRKVYR